MAFKDFFHNLFRSRDHPVTDSTSGSAYMFYQGMSTSGKRVNAKTAMQMTAVYSCVRVLAEGVASLPLHVYRTAEDGSTKKALDNPLYFLLHREPNPEMTSFVFRETLMTHLLLWGNAYAQIIHNGRGEVVALYPLMPDRMTVNRDNNGRLYYEYTKYSDDAKTMPEGTVQLPLREVLHIPGLGFDGLVGYSPIAVAKDPIGLGIACEEFGAKFFKQGAAPVGVLEHPGTIQNPDKLRENWQSVYGGSGNSGKVAVLEEGMKYSPISIPPDQAQFIETRKFQLNEIARIFRVPPHMIGDLEKATFSNIEHLSMEFVKFALGPWLRRWEQGMERALLLPSEKRDHSIKFNVDGLMRGDYESRMNGYAIARQNGWMSANDIRELENLDRIPAEDGGDLYLVNGNMLPLNSAGAAYNKKQSTAPNAFLSQPVRINCNDDKIDFEQFRDKIVAVDFDNTIAFTNYPDIIAPNIPVINAMRKIKSVGGIIILWTCRENDALEKAVDWCKENDVPFDFVNENVPQNVIKYNNDSRKVGADFYVDDKSITLD